MTVADCGDRPMIDAGRNSLDLRILKSPHHLFGWNACREVDIADGEIEEIVADGSADVARESFLRAERLEQPLHASPAPPLCRIDSQRHCSRRERFTIIAAVAPQILRPFQRI